MCANIGEYQENLQPLHANRDSSRVCMHVFMCNMYVYVWFYLDFYMFYVNKFFHKRCEHS